VTVSDNGEGMTPAVRRRALDPYFTTKGERGTGLGLSQVYGFVQQIGGDLKVESQVGVGTSVHLYFPQATEGAVPVEQVA
jgi:signal transduction histidine kinase